jgi:catalase (peroxidase I)
MSTQWQPSAAAELLVGLDRKLVEAWSKVMDLDRFDLA